MTRELKYKNKENHETLARRQETALMFAPSGSRPPASRAVQVAAPASNAQVEG
jgi:hypothetical protein